MDDRGARRLLTTGFRGLMRCFIFSPRRSPSCDGFEGPVARVVTALDNPPGCQMSRAASPHRSTARQRPGPD